MTDPSRQALERALELTAAYASWRRFDPGPGVATQARFAALPVLTKQDLRRDFPAAFVPAGVDLAAGMARGQVEFVTTSGTTGEPMQLLWDQAWWDASERASWQLNAHARRLMTRTHAEAVLASPRCVGPPPKDRPTTREERTLGRLLFLN
jgi:phenylacetate-coenzyme A ligase PaaK-like adenylate-forming protein